MDIGTHRYLLVEDDQSSSDLLVGMLHKIGVNHVEVVDNGMSALRSFEGAGTLPDIIFCDLHMPQLDGIAFLRHLAEKKFSGGLILMSVSERRILRMATELAEAHRLNVLGSLQKPFNFFKSTATLEEMLVRFKKTEKTPSASPLQSAMVTPENLRAAIEDDQLVPFYQPQVDMRTRELVGVEVLARWRHPERGLIPPGLFIPVAEKHGLIDPLTRDIMRKSLEHARAWRQHGLKVNIAINFSAMSLADIELPDRLEAAMRGAGLEPSQLTIEVTESGLLQNIAASMETLLRFRFKGISLSIDDFGTGNSSLEQLHRVPFSELKIDRVFVRGSSHDEEALLMFQSAVALAQQLNLMTVAEGVETEEDWNVCLRHGCHLAQGFLIARPMPNEDFLAWRDKAKKAV